MALIKSMRKFGSTFNSAYFKVNTIELNFIDKEARILMNVYMDKVARQSKEEPIGVLSFTILDNSSFNKYFGSKSKNKVVKASYIYIKSLSEYSDAADDI